MTVSDKNNIPLLKRAVQAGIKDSLDKTGKKATKHVKKGFDTGTDALGRPWQPNAPATIAAKGFDRPLFEHGNLKSSFKHEVNESKGTVEIYSNNETLPIHEFGRSNIPARPVLQPASVWLEQEVVGTEFNKNLSAKVRRLEF